MDKDEIITAIQQLFGDTSRTAEDTRDLLLEIQGEIETMVSALLADLMKDRE